MEPAIKILFVDDDAFIHKALRRTFLDESYILLFANSGPEGLKVMEQAAPVHMVISDFMMPGMNGCEMVEAIKKTWPETKRLLLTAYANKQAVQNCLDSGTVIAVMSKPWQHEELRGLVRRILGRA